MVRETRHLWVGNLPHTIREDRILDHFKRYGKVQSVKILPKKDEESTCATVAFIDIKSAAKAHNADNKIEERTLKTDYYEPPASSTASSAIFIHERDDALVVRNTVPPPPPAAYANSRNARYGLPEERNYDRTGHYYERVGEREPYLRRPIGMGYHDEDNYPGRAKSRDRYVRSATGNNYTEGTDRNQNHFRTHNTRQLFEQPRYSEQYNDERDVGSTTPRLNRRTNNASAASVVSAVASPPPVRSESRRNKRRSPSRTPSGSRSNSVSRSRSRSTSGSRSSSSCSKLRSSSSDSSGRSRSPSKSRSPVASYGSQSNVKRVDRPASTISNPSSMASYLPSSISASAINCTPSMITSSPNTVPLPCNVLPMTNDFIMEKEEKKPLGICIRNLPVRSTDTSLKDGLFHEYKKHGKVTTVKVIGQGLERYAVVCFKKPEDVEKALEVSKDKLFFGCKIEVTAHEGLDADDNEFRPLEAEHDEYHPKATRTLFIGNLEKDITTAELRKHFEQFGEIIEIDIKKQGSSTSYAFIQYSDIASVVKAMRKLDGENLGANRVKLGFGKSMPTNCVWLDGIVDTISEKFLARHFSRFGLVAYCAIDREKGHSLIFYDSVDFAQIAVGEMRGRILSGKKLQVDFASRECQTTFFDKLEMTGQMVPGDRPWERRERRAAEFDIVRGDERETRVPFENRVYTRYEGQTRSNRGNFRGIQRTGFGGRGRGQNFANRYEMYYDEFGERRHRYNSREETTPEISTFDVKVERLKYNETIECNNRKRNKLRNSISDQESHQSVSPPRSRHQSRSTSPVPKDRKVLKDRLHHRIKSPGSHNSSRVNSPCRDIVGEELLDEEYKDFRSKGLEGKLELSDSDVNFPSASPKNNSLLHDALEKCHIKTESDPSRRKSIDSESLDESAAAEQLNQMERKRRLLASLSKEGPLLVPKVTCERLKLRSPASHSISNKLGQVNCVSDSVNDEKNDIESGELHEEKPRSGESANTDLKYLQKKQVHLLHLLEQLHEGVNSSDTEGSVDSGFSRKKRSLSSCIDNLYNENDITKAVTKDECNARLMKSGLKDQISLVKNLTKTDGVDSNNCFSLSLDSFVFRKQIDPRKVDQYTLSSLPKSRRISAEKEDMLHPNNQVVNDSFVCSSANATLDLPWKKQCSDSLLPSVDIDDLLAIRSSSKEELNDDGVSGKKFSSESKAMPIRTLSDAAQESKRERDISPLSLPLPKFAASLRSPKSSPCVLTSPKGVAQSPKTVHSPNPHGSGKGLKIPDALLDLHSDRRSPEKGLEEKVNGTNISPSATSPTESHLPSEVSDASGLESIQSPKTGPEKVKQVTVSSDSDLSPISSPNRPSIADRIKALDEKFNAWSGSTRTSATSAPETSPTAIVELPKCNIKKRSRFNFLTSELRAEPSDIVKSLLSKSTIFDQDSMRLKHIDTKYEPVNVKIEISPKVKPMFRTKAAAKEFSSPIAAASLPAFMPVVHPKTPTGTPQMTTSSPDAPPHSAMSNPVLSPITPPTPHFTQGPSHLYTPCSPCIASFPSSRETNDTPIAATGDASPGDQAGLTPKGYVSLKGKSDPLVIGSVEQTAHISSSLSVALKKDSSKETTQPHLKEVDKLCNSKKEIVSVLKQNIPPPSDYPLVHLKDQIIYKNTNSIDHSKKDLSERNNTNLLDNWKSTEVIVEEVSRALPVLDTTDAKVSASAIKKRVSSVDSSGSESGKSYKSSELSRESQDISWPKLEKEKSEMKITEPECKRPKLSLPQNVRNRSPTPISAATTKKSIKKEKSSKFEKSRSSSVKKVQPSNSIEKEDVDVKPSKTEVKEKPKGGNHKIKEDKKSKFREQKDLGSRSDARTKSSDKKQSQSGTEIKSTTSKTKKDHSASRSDKSKSERKSNSKKSSKSKSKLEIEIPLEPVYYTSMYDKVKARSSKQQTIKHQAQDLETMRQKFSKLKQSRAKREDKSKSLDSDKDSDSMSQLSSDSETRTVKSVKQQRKRKLVIESSSEDDNPFGSQHRVNRMETKDSDSASDSDFDKKVHNKSSKNRKKKTDIIESDSSDSGSELPSQKGSASMKKKPKSKTVQERTRKITHTEDEISDVDLLDKIHAKEKEHKRKKVKKTKSHDTKSEKENVLSQKKPSDESKLARKKVHKEERHSDASLMVKRDDVSRDADGHSRDRRAESELDHMDVDDIGKSKNASRKRKKSKKTSKSKEKRTMSDRRSSEFTNRKDDESESKSSLPVLLSPCSNSPTNDKLLSPPCLRAGDASDNDGKSDFSDDYAGHLKDPDVEHGRNRTDLKTDPQSDSTKINRKKERVFSPNKLHCQFFDSDEESLVIFPEKIGKNLDKDSAGKGHSSESMRKKSQQTFVKKNKESHSDHHKNKHEKSEDLANFIKQSESKLFAVSENSHTKEERRKKKVKKPIKDKKWKSKEDLKESDCYRKDSTVTVHPASPLMFESVSLDNDSRLSDLRLDEEIAKEARRLEQELLAASEETNTFDEGPVIKKEEKIAERKFEEEAAKETKRLEAELFSTGRDAWHLKEKGFDQDLSVDDLCGDDKDLCDAAGLIMKDESIFASLALHSSGLHVPEHENDLFLSADSDQYKLEDKEASELDDQRKIEVDLAVSALLQEMNNGDISAPELTKESDYLEPLLNAQTDDTMNYLIPDDGDNSLHIVDTSSPEMIINENSTIQLDGNDMSLSPSSNSEPPPLEISNFEDSLAIKNYKSIQDDMPKSEISFIHKSVIEHGHELPVVCANTLTMITSENKPPVIDIPCRNINLESLPGSISPRNGKRLLKKKLEYSLTVDELNQAEQSDHNTGMFEDIVLDMKDNKDDDNPPILLPVDLPSRLEPSKETVVKTLVISPCPRNSSIIESPCAIGISDSVIVRAPEAEKSRITKIESEPAVTINIPDSSNNNVLSFTTSPFCAEAKETTLFKLSDAVKNAGESIRPTDSHIDFVDSTLLIPGSSTWQTENTQHTNINQANVEKDLSIKKKEDVRHYPPPKTTLLYYPDMFQRNDSINLDNREISKCDTSVIKSTANINLNMITEPIQKNLTEIEPHIPPVDNFLQNIFPSNKDNRGVVIFNTSQLSKPKETSRIQHIFDYDRKFDDLVRVPEIPACKELTDLLPPNDPVPTSKPEPIHETSKVPALHFPPLFTIPTTEPLLSPGNEKDNAEKDIADDVQKDIADKVEKDLADNDDTTALENNKENIEKQDEFCSNIDTSTSKTLTSEIETVQHTETSFEIKTIPTFESETIENETEVLESQPEITNLKLNKPEINASEESKAVKSKPEPEQEILEPEPEPVLLTEPPSEPETASASMDDTLSKIKEKLDEEIKIKTKSTDVESVSSDTTDIAFSDIKTDQELSQLTSSEEQVQEDVKEEVKVIQRRKPERTRRGRKPKTRRSIETAKAEVPSSVTSATVRAKRGQPATFERTRRSLRSDAIEHVNTTDTKELIVSLDRIECASLSEQEIEAKKSVEDLKTSEISKIESPSNLDDDASQLQTILEIKPMEKAYNKKTDESRKRRGRRKKTNTDHQTSIMQEKADSKSDGGEHSKEYHRPKGSRLWRPTPTAKEQKMKEIPKVLDVFDFVGSDEEDYTSSAKERLRDSTKAAAATPEAQQESKPTEIVHEKVKEPEPKPLSNEDEVIEKEYVTEVIQEGKLIIRWQQKFGQDNTSTNSSETTKNTEVSATEETKSDVPKPEKGVMKERDIITLEGGPSKGTRKSTRLMNQAARSNYDEVIEDVIKGNFKSSDSIPSRVTRRSKANRKSVENAVIIPASSNKEANFDKNKNEPEFVIPDNVVKETLVPKKAVQNQMIEKSPVSEIITPAKSSSSAKVSKLRSYRMYGSANNVATEKENAVVETVSSSDLQKDIPLVTKPEEKKEPGNESPSTEETMPEISPVCLSLPTIQDKFPTISANDEETTAANSEKEKIIDDDNDSLSNSANLIDPKTGFLPSAHQKDETLSEKSENNSPVPIIDAAKAPSHPSSSPPPSAADTKVIKSETKRPEEDQHSSATLTATTVAPIKTIDPFATLTAKSDLTTVSESQMKELKITCSSKPKVTAAAVSSPTLSQTGNNSAVSDEIQPSAICLTIARSPLPAANVAVRPYPEASSKIAFPGIPIPIINQPVLKPNLVAPPEAVANLPLKVQTKANALTDLQFSLSVQNEAPPAHSSNIPPATKGDLPKLQSNQHWSSSSVKEGTMTPVNSAWPSSKLPPVNQVPVVTDIPVHLGAPLHPAVVEKSAHERLSQPAHAHSPAAYLQQAGFPAAYETQSSLQNLVANSSGGVIAELLQNPQLRQQHKEYLANTAAAGSQFQDRQLVRPPTPVSAGIPPEVARLGNRTPPTPLSNTSTHSPDLHNPHVAAGLHLRQPQYSWDLNSFVHPMYPHFTAAHPEFRAQQAAQVQAAMVMTSRFAYPGVPPTAVPGGNFRQPLDPRTPHASFVDHKVDSKKVADMSNSLHDRRTPDKSLHTMKSFRGKKKEDKELKSSHIDDHERPGSGHNKHSISAALRQQHVHYPPKISQLTTHERITNSPVVDNLYGSSEGSLSLLQPLMQKSDTMDRKSKPPPVAHMSSIAFHNLDAVRQQILVSSPVPVYIDGRQPTKPNTYPYKKDSHLVQTMSSTEEQMCADVPKVLPRPISHQDRSVPPGAPNTQIIPPHNAYSIGQHSMMPLNEQDNHRGNQLRVDVPHPSAQNDYFIANKHPVMWQGLLELKTEHAAVQMHYVSGNCKIAIESLPNTTLKITQRMKLEQAQLEGVSRKMQIDEEHCILMALPCGKDHQDVIQQSKKLSDGFIKYLTDKGAAGIVNALKPGSQQPAYVIHIFPPGDFSEKSLKHNAPKLAEIISGITHLVIIIATV